MLKYIMPIDTISIEAKKRLVEDPSLAICLILTNVKTLGYNVCN